MFGSHGRKTSLALLHRFPSIGVASSSLLPSPAPEKTTALRAAATSHGRLIKTSPAVDVSSWNIVLTSYARWSGLPAAQKLFDEMPNKDSVSWNALISACVIHRKSDLAWELFVERASRGFPVDQYSSGSILKSVAGDNLRGRQLHSLIFKVGLLQSNVFSGSALLDMYCKCNLPDEASSVFSSMAVKNTVSWNAMISGYVLSGDHLAALELLKKMERENVDPDEATFATLLSLDLPRSSISQLHCQYFKSGWSRDTIICNAAITAYSQCGSLLDSRRIFLEMEGIRDLVSWNSMLAAYASEGFSQNALNVFVEMLLLGLQQDAYTFTAAISAFFEEEAKELHSHGRSIHCLALKRGLSDEISVSNSLISMYAKSNLPGSISDAMKSFDLMEKKDSVSWNSILTGLSQRGLGEEAMKFFRRMLRECREIDHYAFSAALRSCSDLAALGLGQQLHALIEKSGSSSNPFAASSLISMYSRSGAMESSRRTFDESPGHCSVTWNSIIFAYAQHGHAAIALDLFSSMLEREIDPDHITFVAILSACSHAGMVEEGREIMESMVSVHGMDLRMEHYACGVDLYSRAGLLNEAQKLMDSMPFEPDAMVLKPLLGACRIHGDLELAERVATKLMAMEPEEHSTYVILSNVCAATGRWGERAKIKRMMRDGRVMKVPGWSWIEVKNMVCAFNAEDTAHPGAGEIYRMVGELMRVIAMVDDHDDDDLERMVDDCMNTMDP